MNFLKETIVFITEYEKSVDEILYVMCGAKYCSWEHFTSFADFEYDSGFGCNTIESNLMVVAKDWWLERWEYDGSEGWSFKEHPTKPELSGLESENIFCEHCTRLKRVNL